MTPAVSVVMAARNAAATIADAMDSVVGQTFRDWELLVVDDGSTDETAEIVQQLAASDPRVRLLVGPAGGAARARNLAIEAARGRWLAILDADDVAVPSRLERQVARMERERDLFALASLAHLFVTPGRSEGVSAFNRPTAREDLHRFRETGELLVFCNSSLLFDTDAVRNLGGYDQRFVPSEDAELVNRAVFRDGRAVLLVPEPLVWYRITASGLSTQGLSHQRMVLRYLEERNQSWLAGSEPVALDEFLDRPQPFRTRTRWRRHDLGALLYRQAGLEVGHGSWSGAIPRLLGAGILHPRYVVAKVRAQRGRRVSV
jgi:glycosyltransferase involved in cell wall biosynthesis